DELSRSVQWAEKLVGLNPQSWDGLDSRGCALEDLAWLLRSRDRFETGYAQAVKDFDEAIGDQGQRSVARMHRGRTLFKWAEDKLRARRGFDDAMIRKAEADLATALQETEADAASIRAECHYWQARCAMLRHEANIGDAPALYAAAAKDFATALDFLGKPSASGWFEQAAIGLAYGHVHEAYRF